MSPKPPGTTRTMPVKGTGCGIRLDLDEIGEDTGFDFSKARELLHETQQSTNTINKDTKKAGK